MKLITFISAGTFIVLSAFVMKKEKITPTTSLYGTSWSLQKIYTETSMEEVNTKAFIKLDEKKKRAGGNGSCNTFGSSFIITSNEISFKNIFSTKMYCEDVQQTEDSFLKQLEKVNRFEIKDKRLFFYHDNQILLEFKSE